MVGGAKPVLLTHFRHRFCCGMGHAKNFDTILSSFFDHLIAGLAALVLATNGPAVIMRCLGSPAQAVGIQLLDPIHVWQAIWYPCAEKPQSTLLGSFRCNSSIRYGVKDCPVTGKLPLVIVSHGRGGWFGGHDDVVEALVDAGFVVAAINHPGDNGNDSWQRDSLSVLASRPADVIRLLDFMLRDWKDRAAIDPAKIGFFGFSAGAFTGLVLAGGKPDFLKVALTCTESRKSLDCEQFSQRRHSIQPAARASNPGRSACRHSIELHVYSGRLGRDSNPPADLAI